MPIKNNVNVFDRDVSEIGGYLYSDSSKDISKFFSNSRTSSAIANASSFLGKSVLDVGCGDGVFTLELAKLGASSVVGIDPASKAIESAERRMKKGGFEGRVRFRVANVYDLAEQPERYDIVVLRGVLHHLASPDQALKALAAVGDEIIILEPNGFNPVLKLIERLSPYHRLHEEQSFLPSTIDKWIRLAGKKPSGGQLVNLVPLFCPVLAARILKKLEPIVEATPVLRLFGCGQYIVKGVPSS